MEGEGEEGSVRYVWPDHETIETETHVSMVEIHDSGVPRVELESATVMSTYINLSLTPGIRGVPGSLRRPPRRLCAHTCEPMVPALDPPHLDETRYYSLSECHLSTEQVY